MDKNSSDKLIVARYAWRREVLMGCSQTFGNSIIESANVCYLQGDDCFLVAATRSFSICVCALRHLSVRENGSAYSLVLFLTKLINISDLIKELKKIEYLDHFIKKKSKINLNHSIETSWFSSISLLLDRHISISLCNLIRFKSSIHFIFFYNFKENEIKVFQRDIPK